MNKDKQNNFKRETIGKVLRYVSGYWYYLAASILLALGVVVLTLSVPLLTGDAIDCIVGVDKVDFAALIKILRLIAVVIIVNSIAQWAMARCNNRLTYSVTRDIRDDAAAKLQHLPLKYLDGYSLGGITSRMISDVDQFADGRLRGFT